VVETVRDEASLIDEIIEQDLANLEKELRGSFDGRK